MISRESDNVLQLYGERVSTVIPTGAKLRSYTVSILIFNNPHENIISTHSAKIVLFIKVIVILKLKF